MGKSEMTEMELLNIQNKNLVHVLWQIIHCYEAKSEQLEYHLQQAKKLLNDSHSPTIEQHDTLQEGDWFQGTEEEYRKVLDIYYGYSGKYLDFQMILETGYLLCFRSQKTGRLLLGFGNKKTQLTAPEFIRRAENTFKK